MPANRRQLLPGAGLLLLAGLLASPQSEGFQRQSWQSYEARIGDELLRPRVGDEDRELSQQSFDIRIREGVGRHFHGSLRLGLLSTRWKRPDEDNSARLRGQVLGIAGGGRHPRETAIGLTWEAAYDWHNLQGQVDNRDLELSYREGRVELGAEWDLGPIRLEAGSEWRRRDGDESLRENGTRNRSLEDRPGRGQYLMLHLAMADDGGLSLRYASSTRERSARLIFSRSLY